MAPFFVQGSQADPVSSANGSTLPEQQQANAYHHRIRLAFFLPPHPNALYTELTRAADSSATLLLRCQLPASVLLTHSPLLDAVYRRRFLGAFFPLLLLDLVAELADFVAGLATFTAPELDPVDLRLIPAGTDRERVPFPRSLQM